MTYKATLDYLYKALPMYQRIGSAAYKADLENAFQMDKYFAHQHRSFKTVHVAGTNGKGSVSHMLASVLQSAGYRTGLYTSPHLLDFRERIRVDGKCITRKFVIDFTEKHKSIFEKISPSFFEMTVFMAFQYFASVKVDIAIIEVGMGGRLDTTNIITPEVSVITNIGLDHTQFLGDTLPLIAQEKAGIIKTGIPVVIGETQPETVDKFNRTAQQKNCDIWFSDEYYTPDYALQNLDSTVSWNFAKCFGWNFKNLILDLQGIYQKKNLPSVLMTLWILDQKDMRINKKHIEHGLKRITILTGLMGRWQITGRSPLVVCDVAHNLEGFVYITEQIHSTPYQNLHLVLGFVDDKKLQTIVEILPERAAYYLCEPNIPRAMKLDRLESFFRHEGLSYRCCNSVAEAYISACHSSSPNDLIYIGGSTFVVADFLQWKKKPNSF